MADQDPLGLKSFKIPVGRLAPLSYFTTRAGDKLSYRLYPAMSEKMIILYHGVGSDSRYMTIMANTLAQAGLGNVVTPDFRCHGISISASDKFKESQLEEDLEELLIHLKTQHSIKEIILAGHSMGGGFALRIAVSDLRNHFSKFVALVPYLPPAFQANHLDYGGFISISAADQSIHVHLPELFVTGHEKLVYSWDFFRAVAPKDSFLNDLEPLPVDLQVACGERDEIFDSQRYQQIFADTKVKYQTLPNLNHLTIVTKATPLLSFF